MINVTSLHVILMGWYFNNVCKNYDFYYRNIRIVCGGVTLTVLHGMSLCHPVLLHFLSDLSNKEGTMFLEKAKSYTKLLGNGMQFIT